MSSSTTTPAAPPDGTASRPVHRWWLLITMCTAQLMVVLDATIVNIALPDAQVSLGFDAADRHWVVTAYALVFGSLLLVGGRVADRIGRRRAVLIGLAGFGLASALGGAATDFTMLVLARGLQGLFGALLAPATLAVITTTFTDARERGKAFGIYGAVSAGGGAAGLLLGGVLTEYASWRWTLYVNTVLAAVGILGALATLAHQERVRGQRPDRAGTVTITVGLFGLVYGFSNAYEQGWTDPLTLACLAGGAVLIAAFGVIESRVADPVLPLRVLASRERGASLLVLFLGSVGLFAETLFLTYYLQEDLGFTPVQAGLAFLPQTAGAVAASLLSGVLMRRLSGRVILPLGMVLAAGGAFLLGRIGGAGDYASVVLPGSLLIGAGIGFAFSVAVNLGIYGVRDEDAGVASATVGAVQQIGGSIGPSLFNTIAGSVLAGYLAGRSADDAGVRAAAAVESYGVSFDIAATVLLGAALVSAVMLATRRRRTPADQQPA